MWSRSVTKCHMRKDKHYCLKIEDYWPKKCIRKFFGLYLNLYSNPFWFCRIPELWFQTTGDLFYCWRSPYWKLALDGQPRGSNQRYWFWRLGPLLWSNSYHQQIPSVSCSLCDIKFAYLEKVFFTLILFYFRVVWSGRKLIWQLW